MQAPTASTVAWLLLIPLIMWRVHARFRRMVGRQRLSRIRPWITLAIFPALLALLGWAAWPHAQKLGMLACGVGAGGLLSIYGLRKTEFQATPAGLFYTPNAHLGIALSIVFVARIAYRLVEVFMLDPQRPHGLHDFARSPLTLSVFGVLAGYYVFYAVGLVRWRRAVLEAKRRREAAAQRA